MIVQNLYLAGFRNLAEQEVNFSPEVNLLIGNNAQGKTSLLEALYFLANCKSFRTSRNKDLIAWNSPGAFLRVILQDRLVQQEIEINLTGSQRKILVNQKKITNLVDYLGVLKVICFAPENLSLVKGSPALRREFLDRHMVDINPKYISYLVKYNKALKNKNSLLKNRQANRLNIEAWNQILAELSEVIILERIRFINKINLEAQSIHQKYGPKDGLLTLDYQSECAELPDFCKEAIFKQLNENFEKEVIVKKSLIGPHRDDLEIKLGEQLARNFASQGQTRSIALSLKFAVVKMIEEEYQETPIILLDDLDSELDRERLTLLYDFLLGKNRQIFISGTALPERIQELGKTFTHLQIDAGIATNLV